MKSLGLAVCILILATRAAGDELHPIPPTPAAVTDLVFVLPFKLAKGYENDWSKERQIVTSGTLVVFKVDPELVYPRNSAEPVLYAGDRTVQRLNHGHESGHVIGIIPGEIDLADTPIWFGRPELPERVDAEMIRAERALADEAKIKPIAAEAVKDATRDTVEVEDLAALLRDHVSKLVLEYSPQEKDLAETWQLPVAKPLPKPR